MRVVSQNFVLLGRRGLKLAGLAGVATISGSCAKFPANGNAGFTAITVSFTVAGQINPNYIYDVAFCTATTVNPTSTAWAPVPVINSSNPNGRMAGSPTEFVEFPSQGGYQSANPFELYQFALSSQVSNPNDPTNPVNISAWSPSAIGQITNFTTPWTGGDPSTLTFTIYTNELPDTTGTTTGLQSMYLNILTMTQLASQQSGRIIDGLGNSRTVSGLNNFLQINLLTTGTTNNATGFEPTGDTYGGTDPDVDIVNYSITISPPG